MKKLTDKERLDWLTKNADWDWRRIADIDVSRPIFKYDRDNPKRPKTLRAWIDSAVKADTALQKRLAKKENPDGR